MPPYLNGGNLTYYPTCLTLNLVSLRHQHGLTVSLETKIPRVPINAHVCVYDAQKYKRMHIFWSSCVPGTHKNWVLPRHLRNRLGESPRSAIFFKRSCLHRKRYMTFFSLRNQVKLHLLDRKESLIKILRRFWDPRNVFFLPNGLNKFNLLTCFPALPPCNYYTNTRLHGHTHAKA